MSSVFRRPAFVRGVLESTFPHLVNTNWSVNSPFDKSYQCIAWAACRTDRRWWPDDPPLPPSEFFWFTGIPLDESIDSFVKGFASLGYRPCDNSIFEFGYQKVAIYAGNDGRVRHMARQEFFGRGWLSKPGDLEDFLHVDLASIEGDPSPGSYDYGRVQKILKRSWWAALIRLCLFRCWWVAIKFWIYRLTIPMRRSQH